MPDTLHEKLPLSGRGRRIAFLALTDYARRVGRLSQDLANVDGVRRIRIAASGRAEG